MFQLERKCWTCGHAMLLENEEEQMCADVDINSIVNGSDKNRLPKMCRKCFGIDIAAFLKHR